MIGGALVKEVKEGEKNHTPPESEEIPHRITCNSEKVRRSKPNTVSSFREFPPLFPLFFEGIENNKEKDAAAEAVATDNLCDEKTYIPNPIAVCLLLACCHKIGAKMSEAFKSLVALRTMSSADQVKSWTMSCVENNVDVINPYIESKNQGNDCMRCQHLEMTEQIRPGTRRCFYWTCRNITRY